MNSKIKKLILLFITFVFLYFVFRNLNVTELIETMKEFDPKYAVLLVISILTSLSFRGLCFKLLISQSVKVPLKDLAPLCIAGAALNIALPARAGDIFRAYYVGSKYNANKIKLFGSIMLERIFDGLVILAMLFAGIMLFNKDPLAQQLCNIAAAIFIGSLIFVLLIIKYNKINSICTFLEEKTHKFPQKIRNIILSIIKFTNQMCNSFFEGFEILKSPSKIIPVAIVSVIIWFLEGLTYYITIQGFHCEVDWSIVLFINSFIALACMVPSTSIFIGPYQFAVISAFAIYNISKETALAVSFLEQAIVVIVTAVVTVIFLAKNNISFKELRETTNKKIEE